MRDEKKDWFSEFLKIRHEEFGDPHIAYFGQVNTKTNNVNWYPMDHIKKDGIGGFITILNQLGHHIDNIPSSHPPEPPFIKRFGIWLRAFKRTRVQPAKWKVQLQKNKKHPEQPKSFWRVFTTEQTKQITRNSLKEKASVNSLLLAELSNIIARNFLHEGEKFSWNVPSNLRGALRLPEATANHCSIISVSVDYKTTPNKVQKEIRSILNRGSDWSLYWTVKVFCRYFPKKLQVYMHESFDKHNAAIGCFTNLGQWFANIPNQQPNPYEAWVITPLYNSSYPIAAGSITWNGQLSIALSIHPSLSIEDKKIQYIVDEWFEAIANKIPLPKAA